MFHATVSVVMVCGSCGSRSTPVSRNVVSRLTGRIIDKRMMEVHLRVVGFDIKTTSFIFEQVVYNIC